MLMTSLLIVNTIVGRAFAVCSTQVPNWVDSTTSYVGSNKVGHFFLTKHLIDRVSSVTRSHEEQHHKIYLFSVQFAATTQ